MSVNSKRTAMRKRIRTIMANRDLSAHDLARMSGYSHGYIRGVISGAFDSPIVRCKIEIALGCPIWTPAEEFYEQMTAHKEGN